jgi:LacI family transcriptional regulator, repressor for deo operon, udp, cdd, tsx, nupC, and nupG
VAADAEGIAMTRKGPTGWEVARAANVSQSTVSLVLSGRAAGRVSPATQERVRQIAKDLGYRPHAAARSLRLGRSGLVLLVVPDVQNPFFARVLDGAEQAAHENECSVVLGSNHRGGMMITGAANAVDGVMVCSKPPPDFDDNVRQVPMVVLDSTAKRGVPTVRLDVGDGMVQAVRRLVQLGHHRVGYLRAPQRTPTFLARWSAFKSSTGELTTSVVNAELSVAGAEQSSRELFTLPGPRVTAVICDDDVQAAGLYRAAIQMDIRIPDQLSVIGFGNTEVSRMLYPSLTTVELSGEELGRTGLVMLLDLLGGQQPVRRAILPTTLVVRESTVPPAA